MQPNDDDKQISFTIPKRDSGLHVTDRPDTSAKAAQGVVRGQIDTIYDNDPHMTEPAKDEDEQKAAEPERHGAVNYTPANPDAPNPYERTHDESQHQINPTAWERYHTAWQNYYQQYYERYYVSQVQQTKQQLEQQVKAKVASIPMTEQEAMYELRSDLIGKVKHRATNVRKSRHFWPIISALAVMSAFLLLQYNQIIGAYIYTYLRPGGSGQINRLADPTDTSTITQDDRLIISKIGVDVPIIYDANAASQDSLNAAMDKGVAWFDVQQAHSKPGEKGNFALSGHSSNDWAETGDYKFVFGPLDQMKPGDTFYINYQQKRYIYKVTGSQVVAPTNVSALATDNSKPMVTLITCTPLGTDWNRLLVFADQISPDPSTAVDPGTSTAPTTTEMPKNSPTVLEKLFGGGN